MRKEGLSLLTGTALITLVCATAWADTPSAAQSTGKAAPTDAELIASAESAAPPNVGKHATIVAMARLLSRSQPAEAHAKADQR